MPEVLPALTKRQVEFARAIIRKAYGLSRRVTDEEVAEEVRSLRRKSKRGTYDDFQESLISRMSIGPFPIRFY